MQYMTNDNQKIHYNFINPNSKKMPIVFSHGWLLNWTSFKPYINFFKKLGYPILYFDFQGHGKSSIPDSKEEYSMNHMSETINQLLKHLNITKKIMLIGHSMGGIVNINFSAQYPTKVKYLVLINSSYKGPDKLPLLSNLKNRQFVEILYSKCAKRIEKYVTIDLEKNIDMAQKRIEQNTISFFIDNITHAPPRAVIAIVDHIYKTNLSKQLKKINAATLIINTNKDELFSHESQIKMNKNIENSILKIFPGQHEFFLKNSKVIIQEILQLMQTNLKLFDEIKKLKFIKEKKTKKTTFNSKLEQFRQTTLTNKLEQLRQTTLNSKLEQLKQTKLYLSKKINKK